MSRMQIHLRSPWVVVLGVLLSGAGFCWAQVSSRAVVVKASKRALSPPLSQMTPVPPGSGEQLDGDDEDRMRSRGPIPTRTYPPAATQAANEVAPLAILAPLSTNAGVNILGLGTGFPGYTIQGIVPDTNGAVGQTQFVQFVNESFSVFDKSNGNLIYGPANGDTLWQSLGGPCSTNSNLDEIAQYDKLASVWVMMMPVFASPPNFPYLCIAVSATSDATGSWHLYSFEIPVNSTLCQCRPMPDYPKLAVWPDAYYIAYDEAVNLQYEGSAVCAVDRSAMLSGAAAPTMQCFSNDGATNGVWLAADVDGTTSPPSGSPEYLLNLDSNFQSLDLWQVHIDWTTPSNSTLTGPTNIPVTPFTEPCFDTTTILFNPQDNCVPQAGTSNLLNAYGDRLMYRLAYRNFPSGNYQSLLANHTVQVTSNSNQVGINWYELRNMGSGFQVFQQGTYAPDSNYRWMGSIAMDEAGDIAMGYNVSSSSMSPSIRYAGRMPSDSLGQMESEIDVLNAAGVTPASSTGAPVAPYRWADYSSMAIDPTDDCTFWYTTQYMATMGSDWSTRIASFSFPSCGVVVTPDFSVTPSPSSATVTAGDPANFTVTIAAVGGFNSAVTLTCSAPTAQAVNCSFASTSVNPGNSVKLTVTTMAPSAALTLPSGTLHSHPLYAAWFGFPALGLVGIGSLSQNAKKRKVACLLICVILVGAIAIQIACGSGNNATTPPKNPGTPVGTYTVTINAISGSTQHNSSVSVIVQ
jgi:hypothetical protein